MSFPPAKSTLLIVFAGLLLTSFLLPDDGPLSTGSCLPKEAADKILGQPAMLTESSQEDLANVVKHRCTYSAVKEDSRTHKTGHLYFVDELYRDPTSAHLAFANVLSTNQGMEGQELVNNRG